MKASWIIVFLVLASSCIVATTFWGKIGGFQKIPMQFWLNLVFCWHLSPLFQAHKIEEKEIPEIHEVLLRTGEDYIILP